LGRQPLKRGGLTRTTEGTGGPEPHVIQNDQQNVRRTRRGPQITNGGYRVS
jgi:hypothetical protein